MIHLKFHNTFPVFDLNRYNEYIVHNLYSQQFIRKYICLLIYTHAWRLLIHASHGAIIYTEKSFPNLIKSNRNLIVLYFSIDLNPNGRPFGSKLIEKWYIQSDFGLI